LRIVTGLVLAIASVVALVVEFKVDVQMREVEVHQARGYKG
jgi:hypothetical protein